MTQLSIVLGTYNRKKFLKATINSIREEIKLLDFQPEIIVVDGGSSDGSISWLIKQKDIIAIIQHNRGKWLGKNIQRKSWGYFMNLGFKAANGKYICMLSDDCLVVPSAINNGISHFEKLLAYNAKIGALAFYWRNWPHNEKYVVGTTLSNKMFVNHGIYLKQALVDVDFIDEENFNFYHGDCDLCLKMWNLGYEVKDSPDSYVEHFDHANLKVRKSNLKKEKHDWNNLLNKWEGIFYEKGSDNYGSWLEKGYVDVTKTYKGFIKISNIRLKNKVNQILGIKEASPHSFSVSNSNEPIVKED